MNKLFFKKIKDFNFQCNKCTNFHKILPLLVLKECLRSTRQHLPYLYYGWFLGTSNPMKYGSDWCLQKCSMRFLDYRIQIEFSPCFWVENEFFNNSDYTIWKPQYNMTHFLFCLDYKIQTVHAQSMRTPLMLGIHGKLVRNSNYIM